MKFIGEKSLVRTKKSNNVGIPEDLTEKIILGDDKLDAYDLLSQASNLKESGDFVQALIFYRRASILFDNMDQGTFSMLCMIETTVMVGILAARHGDYTIAIEAFKKAEDKTLDPVHNYAFYAMLCQLASGNVFAARKLLSLTKKNDPMFKHSHKYKVIQGLIYAFKNKNSVYIDDIITKHCQVSETKVFLVWENEILLRIKQLLF